MSSIHSRLSRGMTSLDSRLHTVMTVCLVAVLSYGATKLGIAMIVPPYHLSPFWPTNALLLAVLLLVPRRVWPVLLVTTYVIVGLLDLQFGNSVISASLIELGNVVEVLVAVSLVSYLFGGTPQLNCSKALVQYWCALILASVVAAFVGALALQGDYWLHWRLWFLADSFPLLTLTPAVLGWVQQGSTWARKSRVYYLEAVVPFTVLVLIGYLTLAAPRQGSSPALLYSLVPFLLWSALRFGLTGTATAMIVIAAISIWGAIHGRGPFAQPGLDGVLSLQLFLLVTAAPFMFLAVLVEERKHAEESLASMGRKLIEAHEEERTWIARELHDNVTQRMALLAIELDRWTQLPPSAVEFHDHMHHASQRLSDIAKDIQALSHRLHSSKLEYLGLVGAAKSFCNELSEQQKVEIDFIHAAIPRSVPKEISLCLFRVLQETLQNAVKHSGVRHFKVELCGAEGEVQLTVSDLGVGFNPQDAIHGRGLGLISMRERMLLVSGELSIKSQPGSGTTIHARVPFNSSSDFLRAG